MAPFKLKFRMGGSRSTSQEHDPDPQVSEALLGQHNQLNAATATTQQHQQQQQQPLQQQQTQSPLLGIGASTSTIDSTDCHSLGSVSTNERKSLLPAQHKTNTMRLGYLNQCGSNDNNTLGSQLPKTPPPSYEHVLEENTRLAHSFEYAQRQKQQQHHLLQHSQLSADSSEHSQHSKQPSRLGSAQNSRSSTLFTSLERLTLGSGQCTDPDCRENFILIGNADRRLQRQQEIDNEAEIITCVSGSAGDVADQHDNSECTDRRCITNQINNNNNNNNNDDDEQDDEANVEEDNRKESIDSTELLLTRDNMSDYNDEENAGGGNCGDVSDSNAACGGTEESDDGLCHETNCPEDDHYNDGLRQEQNDSDDENAWHNQQQQQQQQQQQYYQQQQQQQECSSVTPEIISNKSSKEIYKDLAKQWGITCKMSDGCRCMDCQSNYFDCEFDDNEHQKTDGGLGAGTPMFISEVMHGSACTIL